MRPDDPRHGTYAGYTAGCHDDCCLTANRAYTKRLIHEHNHGQRRTIAATGFRRRIRALQALGWSVDELGQMLGVSGSNLRRDLGRNRHVKVRRHRDVARLYDRLSMTVPSGAQADRLRRLALKHGYLPPLAWDDIDNDPEPPESSFDEPVIDEVKVARVLGGVAADCNTAERYSVLEAWKGSLAELERLTGWHVHRMMKTREAA